MVWMMPAYVGEGHLLFPGHQFRCSCLPQTLSETSPEIMLSQLSLATDLVKLIHKINHPIKVVNRILECISFVDTLPSPIHPSIHPIHPSTHPFHLTFLQLTVTVCSTVPEIVLSMRVTDTYHHVLTFWRLQFIERFV